MLVRPSSGGLIESNSTLLFKEYLLIYFIIYHFNISLIHNKLVVFQMFYLKQIKRASNELKKSYDQEQNYWKVNMPYLKK